MTVITTVPNVSYHAFTKKILILFWLLIIHQTCLNHRV
jgi:hypothetical protein